MNTAVTTQGWQSQIALFLGGQAASLLGSGVVQFALIWYITLDSRSGAMVTIATLVGLVPMVCLMPWGGVLADRYSRRLLIVGADLVVAASTAVLLIALLIGYDDYWLIFTVMGVRAVGAGIQGPAVGALLPQIVPARELGRINGYNVSIQAAVNLASPLLAGGILSFAPLAWVLAIDLVTAAIGVTILLVWITTPAHAGAAAARERHPLHDLREGLQFIFRHVFLRRLIAYFAVINLLAVPAAILTPLQVARTFSDDYWRLAVIEITLAIGMVVGGIAAARWGNRRSRIRTMAFSAVAIALATIALGVPFNFVLYCSWMLAGGMALPFLQAPAITMVQLAVPSEKMGRVMSLVGVIAAGVVPVGILFFGPLADHVSIEVLLIVSGVLFLAVSLVIMADRALAAGEPAEPPPPADEPAAAGEPAPMAAEPVPTGEPAPMAAPLPREGS